VQSFAEDISFLFSLHLSGQYMLHLNTRRIPLILAFNKTVAENMEHFEDEEEEGDTSPYECGAWDVVGIRTEGV